MRTINKSDNAIDMMELQEMLATEKLDHISSIIKFQFGIECEWAINPNEDEYTIYLEDEGEEIYFHHTYSMMDLINCDATGQAYFLRRWFNICSALEAIREHELRTL